MNHIHHHKLIHKCKKKKTHRLHDCKSEEFNTDENKVKKKMALKNYMGGHSSQKTVQIQPRILASKQKQQDKEHINKCQQHERF